MRALWLVALLCACGDDDLRHIPDATSSVAPGIYVTSVDNAIIVFALDASDAATPIRTISGATTTLALPIGIVVDHEGNVYAANRMGSTVTMFTATANGNVAPARLLTSTGMLSPEGLALAPNDDIIVSTCPDCGASAGGDTGVYHFAAGSSTSDFSLMGTSFADPASIAVDATGDLIVANSFGGTVETFASVNGASTTPTRTFTPIAGQNTQSMALGATTIALTSPGRIVDFYDATATGTPNPSDSLDMTTIPLSYPGGLFFDTSVAPPVLYLVDVGSSSLYVIGTSGAEPNLTVASVQTITGIDMPLDVTVVH